MTKSEPKKITSSDQFHELQNYYVIKKHINRCVFNIVTNKDNIVNKISVVQLYRKMVRANQCLKPRYSQLPEHGYHQLI
mgnify:FL=1